MCFVAIITADISFGRARAKIFEYGGYSGDIIQYSLPSLSDRIKFYAMARISRLVVPGYPHHITQRGVRSMDIFNCDEDRHAYIKFMANEGRRFGVRFLAWCLMDNHVHLIAVPSTVTVLARAIGEAHRRYTRMKNFSEGVRDYLFQRIRMSLFCGL